MKYAKYVRDGMTVYSPQRSRLKLFWDFLWYRLAQGVKLWIPTKLR